MTVPPSAQVCAACGEENPGHARFCLACAEPLVQTAPAGEERKVVSVLFVDLVGFTARSDRADPEDVRAALRPYHERLKIEIERFGGTVEKFIGDAVMAVFGAPVAHEDDAERAVRAALRILEAIEELNEERDLDLAVRAAVATGEAVVALGARPERGEGIATGDIVNTAARLQNAAPVGSVIVDETTMRVAGDAIETAPLEPVSAKGKAEPIPVWRAIRARSRYGVEAEPRARTPFVGREHDLALLADTFTRVLQEPSVQLVTVIGEPGLGKSRLVWEFSREVDRRPELVRWRQGRCLPYGEGITFWALGEIVKAESGILDSDSPAQALEKLRTAVPPVISDESERTWFVDRLAPLVGAQDDVESVGREEAFTAWRRYVEALASVHPFVFVLEDLHWADDSLLDFVEHLLDWAASVPLLVVATARPELYDARPGWGGGRRNSTALGLSPLSNEDTARLVARLLERSVLPADTQAALLERAAGNPLYAEQFVRMMVERGSAVDVALPETVQALIAGRLDTLAPDAKALLHDAAVLGKVFWTGALAAMGGRSREDILEALRELVRREFVRPSRVSSVAGEDELSFWHVLVRDVAYQQIPRGPRAEKHVRAAEWIEQAAAERVSDHAEILVYHYDQALELGRASGEAGAASQLEERLARFLVLAGDRAMRLDIAAAEASYRHALALSPGDSLRAAALVKLAGALQEQGRLVEAEQAYEEALPALDEHAAAVAKLGLSWALWRRGDTSRAHAVTLEAIPTLEREPGPDLVLAYGRAAGQDSLGGRPREAIVWAEKGIALAKELGVENVVRHLQFRGLTRIDLLDREGLEDMHEALDLSLRLGLGIETATAYGNLGGVLFSVGERAGALEFVDAGLEFARRRGLTHHVMWSRSARLIYLYEGGEWDELLREADDVLRWDREQGGTIIEVIVLASSALVHAHRGDLDQANREAAIFLPRAREIRDPQILNPALLSAALVAAMSRATADAVPLVTEFERGTRAQVLNRCEWLPMALRVCTAAGELELAEKLLEGVGQVPAGRLEHAQVTARAIVAEAKGQTEDAAAAYAEAAEGWAQWGSVIERGYALLGLGRCGDAAAMRAATEIFGRLGAVPLAAMAA
jgi:class 3 adenylate cyclase/tetratricopeptide (TPR) repeat protein